VLANLTALEAVGLVVAGIGGGLTGSVAGLASLVTYPTLLAIGLPPVSANVTNTVSLLFSSIGSVSGSRPDLVGQRTRVIRFGIAAVIGGITGGVLVLATPGDAFEKAVPWLIAMASLAILLRRKLVETSIEEAHHTSAITRRQLFAFAGVGVYSGYFGAGAGVMMLALLLFVTGESLPRANAAKNTVLGMSNGVAALTFAVFGPVRWTVVLPLGAGLFVGGRLGPLVVRRAPHTPLRIAIAVAGVGLAVKLALDAY
jgi:uncharacterized membrane protein YfcA